MRTGDQTTSARTEHPAAQTSGFRGEEKLSGGGEIRLARERDACGIALLLGELGYPRTRENVFSKITDLSAEASDSVFVAECKGELLGMGHLHVANLVHREGGLGRVMALVVRTDCRRQGVGRAILSVLEEEAHKRGCTTMEITSSMGRSGAHRFYRKMGYEGSPLRFVRNL
jgi:GNAT superfamily N-acetyltransferase